MIIVKADIYGLTALEDTFKKNSDETIWALQPVTAQRNTQEAYFFSLPLSGPSSARPYFLSDDLISSFEKEDLRKQYWIDSVTTENNVFHFASKYKISALGEAYRKSVV